MDFITIKTLINEAKDNASLGEARAALSKFRVTGGDNVELCKLYQLLQNKSRKLVNVKPLTQRTNSVLA